jgi:hypothetical protein
MLHSIAAPLLQVLSGRGRQKIVYLLKNERLSLWCVVALYLAVGMPVHAWANDVDRADTLPKINASCLSSQLSQFGWSLAPDCHIDDVQQFTVTVSKEGKGDGLVISNEPIPQVNCGSNCSSIYENGHSVTFMAFPNADSVFAGWRGCDSTANNNFINTCILRIVDADKTVRVIFRGRNAPLISNKSVTPHAISPNSDGVQDIATISFNVEEKTSFPVGWTIIFRDQHRTLRTFQGSLIANGTVHINWAGKDDNNTVMPDGTYTVQVAVTNAEGNATAFDLEMMVDKTSPVLVGRRASGPNAEGWNNADVTLIFTCSDSGSGVAVRPLSPQTVSAEGLNQSRDATCTDHAGNVAHGTIDQINIDKTPPVVTVIGIPNGRTYDNGSVPLPGCATIDTLSGVETSATMRIEPMPIDGLGSHTITCEGARDKAGNSVTASASYAIITCVNVSVSYGSDYITFRPTRFRKDARTLKVIVQNHSGGPIIVNEIALDPVKFPAEIYSIAHLNQGIRQGQPYIKPGLPQTIMNGRDLVFYVKVEKMAGSGRQRVSAPYVDVSMSCGNLPIGQRSQEEALHKSSSSALGSSAKNFDPQTLPMHLELFDLQGRELINLYGESRSALLSAATNANASLANGVYFMIVTIRAKDNDRNVLAREMKKFIVLK